ncbi:MAG: hypothetical protein FWF29_07850 [Treponema sp.]|nr:hypothetical protein [Treponema sp.]
MKKNVSAAKPMKSEKKSSTKMMTDAERIKKFVRQAAEKLAADRKAALAKENNAIPPKKASPKAVSKTITPKKSVIAKKSPVVTIKKPVSQEKPAKKAVKKTVLPVKPEKQGEKPVKIVQIPAYEPEKSKLNTENHTIDSGNLDTIRKNQDQSLPRRPLIVFPK